jgi:hypothetical protein
MSIETLTPSEIEYLKRRVRKAQDIFPNTLDGVKKLYSRGMQLVWDQEGNIGPAEIFESLGTEGGKLFQDGVDLLTFILSKDPGWIYSAPTHEYTINPDGSVTIGLPLAPVETQG